MRPIRTRRESAIVSINAGIRLPACYRVAVPCCFLLFSLLVVSGCARGSARPVLGQKETDEHADIIRGLPFYPQEDYQCGPASLASVLNYWGGAVTPGDVAEDIYSRSARGTLNIDMALYAEARGLDASFYSGGLPDVKSKIEAGYPLIVLVDLGFSFYQVNHFMVVVG